MRNSEDLSSLESCIGGDMIVKSCTMSCCESDIVASKRAKVGKQAPSYDMSALHVLIGFRSSAALHSRAAGEVHNGGAEIYQCHYVLSNHINGRVSTTADSSIYALIECALNLAAHRPMSILCIIAIIRHDLQLKAPSPCAHCSQHDADLNIRGNCLP